MKKTGNQGHMHTENRLDTKLPWHPFHCRRGFSLAELMTVVGVIGIISAIAAPSIMRTIPRYELRGAARDLMSNFHRAKAEAIKRGENVAIVFTPATDSYQIFVDNGDTPATGGLADDFIPNGTEEVLSTVAMPQQISLTATTFTNNGTGYNPRGLPLGSRIGTATLSIPGNPATLEVRFSAAGRVRLLAN